MATSDSIKIKTGSTTHNINLMKYKKGSDVKTITSVWYVNNGNKNLVWPKSYDAVLEIVPTYSGNLNAIPASGGTITLDYYLTIYYPNTTIPVTGYSRIPVTNNATESNDQNNWVVVHNNKTNTDTYPTKNKNSLVVDNRGCNGFPQEAGPNNNPQEPVSDGSWTWHINAYKQVIINTVTVTATASLDFTQLANNIASTVTRPNGIDLYFNNTSGNIANVNTASNPAPYTATTIYGAMRGTVDTIYTFDSGSTYTLKKYPNEYQYPWYSNATWARVTSSNWTVALDSNNDTAARSAIISVSVAGQRYTYTIWQAGAPKPEPEPTS